jgi:ribosome maturation factor RimP
MINEKQISKIIQAAFEGTDKFVVDVKVRAGNKILVLIDSDSNLTIDDCAGLSRFIESNLDRETEDFELNVSSPGIDAPYRNFRQYVKNVGRQVTVVTSDGNRLEGTLSAADETGIELTVAKKIRKELTETKYHFTYAEIKETKEIITF